MARQAGLDGKRAVVIAASSGLGLASARALAEGGADVAICARGTEQLEEAADGIREDFGVKVYQESVDQVDKDQLVGFIEHAAAELGGLDVLVNNSGGPRPGLFTDLEDEDYYQAFDLVFMSAVRATRAALPYLQDSDRAAIVNITSLSVKRPLSRLMLSNSVRMGVIGLAKTLSQELAPGIRVNNVAPNSVHTPRIDQLVRDQAATRGISFEDALADRASTIPLGRLGQPGELGNLVAFLASDQASFISGVTIQIDGGRFEAMF